MISLASPGPSPPDRPWNDHLKQSRPKEVLTPSQSLHRFLHLPMVDLIGITLVFLAGFLMLVDVKVDKDTVALDSQVLLKLAVIAGAGLYGAMGFMSDKRVRSTLFSFPVLWMVLIIGFYFLAVMGSITPRESLASAIAMLCITLLTVTAVIQLKPIVVLTTLFYSLSLYVACSWAMYFTFPEIGIFAEPIEDGQFAYRMAGLAHPNTLGQFSGLTILLGSILYAKFDQRSYFRIAIMLLAGLALFACLSRTSMLATAIGLLVAFRFRMFQKQRVLLIAMACLMLAIGLVALSFQSDLDQKIEKRLASISKSGDTEELTSATGRSDIWAFACRKIAERPLIGYGAATSKYYLSDYSSYTHNLVLNVAFSTGIFGGLLALAMCLSRLIAILASQHPVADGIVAFILINGLFENVMFSFLAGLPTMIWIVALCLPRWMPIDEVAIPETRKMNQSFLSNARRSASDSGVIA